MCCKKSFGILIIRLGFGAMLIMGGVGKIMGATPEMMNMIGGAAHTLGLTFLSTEVWFWLAAIGELIAGILFVVGLFLPLAGLLTVVIMLVAFFGVHAGSMQSGMAALTFLIAGLGMGVSGPGKYSLAALCCKKSAKCVDGKCDMPMKDMPMNNSMPTMPTTPTETVEA